MDTHLHHCLLKDLPYLRRNLPKLAPAQQPLPHSRHKQIQARLQASLAAVEARRAACPAINYPDLPVSAQRDKIIEALRTSQVVVIAGETGSGKTTQLPKICLELGLADRGLIGHTQPRRLAARNVAQRLAEELDVTLGAQVGYQVRFQDLHQATSLVKIMTDGILLAETQNDPYLNRYSTLIIDEAHERSLNIDFLLGYLKRLLPKRPDLKIIITSATLDVNSFARHFDNCPIVEVSGRSYPVQVEYQPLVQETADSSDLTLQQGIVQALQRIEEVERNQRWHKGPRDVLVFLAGEADIRASAQALRQAQNFGQFKATQILPLYARLPASEQQKIFQPSTNYRRIILATNVAETSVTVPGIRYVIDSGTARISRYSTRAGVQRLPIESISQASANQRSGRCGRLAEGWCIRLYSATDFNSRPEFTQPEIKRTNLAAVILQMLALKLGRIEDFPFLEAPENRSIKDGLRLLFELGAVDKRNQLTQQGQQLARLPLDPRLARMLLAAAGNNSLQEALIVVAALTLQDPRERPTEQQQAADQAHAQWQDPHSDFASLINLWRSYSQVRTQLSNSQLRSYCQKNFLSWLRMREWRATYTQLKLLSKDLGWQLNQQPATAEALHQALLTGLLSNLGIQQDNKEFLGARNRKFFVHPGSKLAKKPPKWIMAAELVATSRLYARNVAKIDPSWVEPLAQHLIKREFSAPHWEKKAARVAAYESLTLFGLPLVTRRKVDYTHQEPELCHEIFIRNGLVEGNYASQAPFMRHNQALLDEVLELEDKARKRDIVVDDEVLYAFYAAKIPTHICRGTSFEHWRRQEEAKNPHLLFVTKQELLARSADEVTSQDFPNALSWQGTSWPLSYNFAPGQEDDGVTLQVPLAMLNQLPAARLEWLVPGLLEEKCLQLMRGLPKQLRKNFVPLPNYIQAALAALKPSDLPLGQALGDFFAKTTGVQIPPASWAEIELPAHLHMNFKVIDEQGRQLAQGRDITALRQKLGQQVQAATQALAANNIQTSGATSWSFAALPAVITQQQAGTTVQAFPAVVDEGKSVGVTLFDNQAKAWLAHKQGLTRLLRLSLPQKDKYLRTQLPDLNQLALMFAKLGSKQDLLQDLLDASIQTTFLSQPAASWPRDAQALHQLIEQQQANWVPNTTRTAQQLKTALQAQAALAAQLKGQVSLASALAIQDMQRQLQRLFAPGFIQTAGPWLQHYPRYLQAIEIRLEKCARDRIKDQRLATELEDLWQRWDLHYQALYQQGCASPQLADYRWLIEEYRVSLYAQQLGTSQTVSAPRLEQAWKKLLNSN